MHGGATKNGVKNNITLYAGMGAKSMCSLPLFLYTICGTIKIQNILDESTITHVFFTLYEVIIT